MPHDRALESNHLKHGRLRLLKQLGIIRGSGGIRQRWGSTGFLPRFSILGFLDISESERAHSRTKGSSVSAFCRQCFLFVLLAGG